MQEIINRFIAENFNSIKSDYRWRIKEEHLPAEVNLDPSSNYVQNLQLKRQLNGFFVDGDFKERLEIINYYIAKWGGVIRNSEETIRIYSTMDCEALIDFRNTGGIASWSKALCVRDPKKYAIFDARVSATLNLLLLENTETDEKLFFPRLPSRNSTIRKINQHIQESRVSYRSNRVVYREYMSLIHNAANHVGTDIQTVEMILFSHPEGLYAALEK